MRCVVRASSVLNGTRASCPGFKYFISNRGVLTLTPSSLSSPDTGLIILIKSAE